MRLSLFEEQRTAALPVGLLVVARIANLMLGLAVIPVLIHYLGGDGFAAWALLLAIGAALALLELGMALTYVKEVAPLIQHEDWRQVNVVRSNVVAILLLAFAAGALPLFLFATAIARELHVPDGTLLEADQMVKFIYLAVALRALLQLGTLTLNAARRFRALAFVSFLQSFVSNGAAAVAAVWTRRLDITLLAFWFAQLLVLAIVFVIASRRYIRASIWVWPSYRRMRELCSHGLKIQVHDWAQVISYQFDKFLIAAFMGLWAVAPYEVGNRSVAALRSIPSSGIDSFLATAAIGQTSKSDLWQQYQRVTQLAGIAVLVFMIAPLAIAPVFLYAWTGEMGYTGRWVFLSLILGAAFSVLALPAAAMAQAAGRAEIQARAAVVTLLINVPLSFFLIFKLQLVGVAAGTAIAMAAGATVLLADVHKAYAQSMMSTLKPLWRFCWPPACVCAAFALLTWVPFELWLASLDPATRFAREMRVIPGLLAGLAYVVCLISMLGVQIHRGALTAEQQEFVCRLIPFRWFRSYCAARHSILGEK